MSSMCSSSRRKEGTPYTVSIEIVYFSHFIVIKQRANFLCGCKYMSCIADILKFSETVAMVVTQHVHSKTLLKAISNRGAEMTLDNLLMKMNLKLGGISHALASSTLFLRSNQLAANIMYFLCSFLLRE